MGSVSRLWAWAVWRDGVAGKRFAYFGSVERFGARYRPAGGKGARGRATFARLGWGLPKICPGSRCWRERLPQSAQRRLPAAKVRHGGERPGAGREASPNRAQRREIELKPRQIGCRAPKWPAASSSRATAPPHPPTASPSRPTVSRVGLQGRRISCRSGELGCRIARSLAPSPSWSAGSQVGLQIAKSFFRAAYSPLGLAIPISGSFSDRQHHDFPFSFVISPAASPPRRAASGHRRTKSPLRARDRHPPWMVPIPRAGRPGALHASPRAVPGSSFGAAASAETSRVQSFVEL